MTTWLLPLTASVRTLSNVPLGYDINNCSGQLYPWYIIEVTIATNKGTVEYKAEDGEVPVLSSVGGQS